MPWPVGQKVLASHHLERGQGWDKTVERHENGNTSPEKEAELSGILKEHLITGEKLSQFSLVTDREKDILRTAILAAQPADSLYRQRYPNLLSEQQLSTQSRGLNLVAVEQLDDGLAAVFTSVRTVTIRETFETGELPAAAADALQGYDEIVGLKNLRLQAFDVVWVPTQGNVVELRVDFPRGMHQASGEAALEQIRDSVRLLTGLQLFAEAENLFPLIERMYRTRTEGTVVELSFGTSTASTKHEKMRRQSLDLREERYHVGGVANLTAPIEPFRISIQWRRPMGGTLFSHPELTLNGSQHRAGAENPRLLSAVVRKCIRLEDYEYVRGRVIHHLENGA